MQILKFSNAICEEGYFVLLNIPFTYHLVVRERFVNVEKSLSGQHEHSVEAPGERHLGQRQDVGSEARLGLLAVLG